MLIISLTAYQCDFLQSCLSCSKQGWRNICCSVRLEDPTPHEWWMSVPGQVVTHVCVLTECKERGKVTSKWLGCILRAPVPILLSQRSREQSYRIAAGMSPSDTHNPASTLFAICIYYRSSLKWEGFCFSCYFHYFFQRRTKTRMLGSAEPWTSCFSRWASHMTASKHAEKCLHSWTHRRRTRGRD